MWGDFCEIYLPANDKSNENKKNNAKSRFYLHLAFYFI